jgi:hypothetical protein
MHRPEGVASAFDRQETGIRPRAGRLEPFGLGKGHRLVLGPVDQQPGYPDSPARGLDIESRCILLDVVAEAVGLEAAFEGADLALTGEGKLDASSLAGKVVGGVLAWADDLDVEHVAIVAGQATDEARLELSDRAGVQVLALTDRVWQSSETYTRTALLVEEAAIEAARNVLGTPAP